MQSLPIAIALVIGAAILGFVGFTAATTYQTYTTQTLRNQAVDGCMQNSRYQWLEANREDATLTNTTQEPTRYWYKICMEEKGQEIRANLE